MVDQVSAPVSPESQQWDLRTADYYYLARVEEYLVHKYAPDLIEEMHLTFRDARLKSSGVLVYREEQVVFSDANQLLSQIQSDMQRLAPWKPPNPNKSRKKPTARPGISDRYQRQFEAL